MPEKGLSPERNEMIRRRVAFFVSAHGFGHAARAASVMSALHRLRPGIRFEVFTTVPRWFFEHSLRGVPVGYHRMMTDIGLVQADALCEDLEATLRRLEDFLPLDLDRIDEAARLLESLGCEMVVCDISPVGLEAAGKAGIPSLLIENFTWDWIYSQYGSRDQRFLSHSEYLKLVFSGSDYHIQTEPVCLPRTPDLTVFPMARPKRTPPAVVRDALGIPRNATAVLITMGGIREEYRFLDSLSALDRVHFVVPGGSLSHEVRENLVLLPHDSPFFHPDIVHACDAVIGKVGYSTLAEAYHAGVPYGYVTRIAFPESPVLAEYIETHMECLAFDPEEFRTGDWFSRLGEILAKPRVERTEPNGADQAAHFLSGILEGSSRSSAPRNEPDT